MGLVFIQSIEGVPYLWEWEMKSYNKLAKWFMFAHSL